MDGVLNRFSELISAFHPLLPNGGSIQVVVSGNYRRDGSGLIMGL